MEKEAVNQNGDGVRVKSSYVSAQTIHLWHLAFVHQLSMRDHNQHFSHLL